MVQIYSKIIHLKSKTSYQNTSRNVKVMSIQKNNNFTIFIIEI